MKKILLVVLAIVLIGGCATLKDFFCSNRVTIEQYVATAQATITSIQTSFPGVIPPEYMAAIAAANAVITLGNNYLATMTCPDAAAVAAVQVEQTRMNEKVGIAARMTTIQMSPKIKK